MNGSSTSPVSPTPEKVGADSRKPSQRNGTVSFDLEDIYVKPFSRFHFVEALKPKSESPVLTNEGPLSPTGPCLLTFKKSKKVIPGYPVNRNLFTGNQTTPIKSVCGPVPKGQNQNFRKRSLRKHPLRQSEFPTNPPPVTSPPPTSYSIYFLSWRHGRLLTHFWLPTNKRAQTTLNKTSSEVSTRCVYANCLSLPNKLPEIKQLAHNKKPCTMAYTETWLSSE